MSNAGLVLGLIAVGVVDGALVAAFAALLFQRRRRHAAPPGSALASLAPIDFRALTSLDGDAGVSDGVPLAAYDRVVRIAGWAWILSTAILVSTSGLWPDRQSAVFDEKQGATLELRALTVGQAYWVAIESFDENGVSSLSQVVPIR